MKKRRLKNKVIIKKDREQDCKREEEEEGKHRGWGAAQW